MGEEIDEEGTVARLKEALEARGLTTTAFCRRAETSEGTLRGILAGRRTPNLTLSTTRRYARVLGVSPSWLGFGHGERDAPAR